MCDRQEFETCLIFLSNRNVLSMYYLTCLMVTFGTVLCISLAYHPADCDYSDTYYNVFKVGKHNCECNPRRAGQIKFENNKIQVCVGDQWKSLQYELPQLGNRSNPAVSCEEIKANRRCSKSGIYWITLKGKSISFKLLVFTFVPQNRKAAFLI